jgi:hypothetical protein
VKTAGEILIFFKGNFNHNTHVVLLPCNNAFVGSSRTFAAVQTSEVVVSPQFAYLCAKQFATNSMRQR